MKRNGFLLMMAIAALALSAWTLTGCGGSGNSSNGTGTLRVALVDAPLNASEVNVDIDSVQVHGTGGGWVTVETFSPAKHVNLLDYSTGGNSLMLVDSPLAAGHYTMIRLMISKAEVVVDGQPYDVDISNVAQTGVKCNGQFTVESNQLCAVTLDFITDRSFVKTGNGVYKLHPVMSMSPVNIAAKVTGSVEFQDAQGTVLPLPADVVVNVYPQGSAGNADALIAGAAVQADGTFEIPVIAAGTYDFQILVGATVVVPSNIQNPVTITSPATDMGKIIIIQ
ncbi:MAG: DUF4382 domain-containing protein [Armatimonadota bacterium]